jgi:hypothetical protein
VGEVGKDEAVTVSVFVVIKSVSRANLHASQGKSNSYRTLQNEQPTPGLQTMDSVQTILNTSSYKTTKATGQETSGVEDGSTGSELSTSVPTGE